MMERNVSLQRLTQHGAEVVGGTCYLNHKEVGRFHNGQFITNDEGANILAELQAQDAITAEVANPTPATDAPHPKNRAAKAPKPVEAAPVVTPVAVEAPAAPVAPVVAEAPATAPFVPPPAAPLPKALQAEADAAAGLMADLAALGVAGQ